MENKKYPERFKKKPSLTVFEHGKMQPQAIDVEEAVLGALMLEKDKIITLMRIFNPNVFYKEEHVKIAEAIRQLYNENVVIDILTVTERLRKNGHLEEIGGPYYVAMLTNRVVSSRNIEWHWRIMQQKFMRREMIRICSEVIRDAFDETIDVYQVLDQAIKELDRSDIAKHEKTSLGNTEIAANVMTNITTKLPKGVHHTLETRWRNFNSKVITSLNRIILIAGGAKMGKTKFVTMWISELLELYRDLVAVDWITLEDGAEDIVCHYLASKVHVKGKDLKSQKFPADLIPTVTKWINEWSSFDIDFIDQSIKISQIASHFKLFCSKRPKKFKILVIDNILSLGDRNDYKHDLNSFYDHVMNEILLIRQDTKALIIVVHHFNDAQQNKENLKDGYRPRLTDIKGTEAFRRVPNQVLLINTPGKYKDLLAQYKGERKENLKKMFIIDVGATRDDDNIEGDEGVIHMFGNLDYNVFKEVEYYDPRRGTENHDPIDDIIQSYEDVFTPTNVKPEGDPF